MKFRDRYKFDPRKDLIGKGGFARVFKAIDTVRKREVALKFYHGVESDKYDIISEINRMEDIVHPNLIRYYDATYIESINALGERERIQVGIMEYANAGDIGEFFSQKRSVALTHNVVLGILKGLKHLHEQGIAHRDLKPKNILLSHKNNRLHAKIADFGISKRIGTEDASMSSQLLGSVEYMSPEQFAPAVYGIDGRFDLNADLWAFGIIVYEIFSQRLPFGSRTKGITYEQILNNILFQDLNIDYRPLAEPYRTIVRRCLVKKATERARSAAELVDFLEGKTGNIQANTTAPTKQPKANTNNSFIPQDANKTRVISPTKPNDSSDEGKTLVIPNNNRYNKAKPPIASPPKQKDRNTLPPKRPKSVVPKPKPPIGDASYAYYASHPKIIKDIQAGNNLFRLGNYVGSFKLLDQYQNAADFNTESLFYLGFMYYNGKCGGAHDVDLGRRFMNEAKRQNRSLVMDLMMKYVLKK